MIIITTIDVDNAGNQRPEKGLQELATEHRIAEKNHFAASLCRRNRCSTRARCSVAELSACRLCLKSSNGGSRYSSLRHVRKLPGMVMALMTGRRLHGQTAVNVQTRGRHGIVFRNRHPQLSEPRCNIICYTTIYYNILQYTTIYYNMLK